jgi:hypothetical protein
MCFSHHTELNKSFLSPLPHPEGSVLLFPLVVNFLKSRVPEWRDNMNQRAWLFLTVGLAIGASTLPGCGKKPGSETGTVAQPAEDPKVVEFKKASENNLREIVRAMIEDRTQDEIPAGIYAADGKNVGLSWRVAILPGLKQDELYKQFRLDEPWDGPNNKKLIAKMPGIFAAPGKTAGEGLTYYRSFTGKESVMLPPVPGIGGKIVPGVKWPLGILDGTANTAVIAEAADPVIWTKPDELEFDRQKPLPKLGGIFADGYHIVFADSHARFFAHGSLSDDTLKAIITPCGDEMFNLPEEPGKPPANTWATSR